MIQGSAFFFGRSLCVRRSKTGRVDAAAADVGIIVETGRGTAAGAAWIFRGCRSVATRARLSLADDPRCGRGVNAILPGPYGVDFHAGRYLMLGRHRGFEADFHAERAPWSFRCEAIARPVLIWHGAEDRIITEEISTFTAERIPGCVLETVEGAGHVSFLKMETQHEHVKRLMALCAERAGRTREA